MKIVMVWSKNQKYRCKACGKSLRRGWEVWRSGKHGNRKYYHLICKPKEY